MIGQTASTDKPFNTHATLGTSASNLYFIFLALEKLEKDSRDWKNKTRESSRDPIEGLLETEIKKPEEEAEGDQEAEKLCDDPLKPDDKKCKKSTLWMEYDNFCQCFRWV